MVLVRITENEPSKMHNVRPYVYSRPWPHLVDNIEFYLYGHSKLSDEDNKNILLVLLKYINDTGRFS